MQRSPSEITLLLGRAQDGDDNAREQLFQAIYDELRTVARTYLRGERPDHSLEATALVNEACIGLLQQQTLPGRNRVQLRAYIARAMRHVLIDHARERGRLKRGGQHERVPLEEGLRIEAEPSVDLLSLDDALQQLSDVDARKARVVELRFFGGLAVDEIGDVLDVSPATVKRDWDIARTWLKATMRSGETHGG